MKIHEMLDFILCFYLITFMVSLEMLTKLSKTIRISFGLRNLI